MCILYITLQKKTNSVVVVVVSSAYQVDTFSFLTCWLVWHFVFYFYFTLSVFYMNVVENACRFCSSRLLLSLSLFCWLGVCMCVHVFFCCCSVSISIEHRKCSEHFRNVGPFVSTLDGSGYFSSCFVASDLFMAVWRNFVRERARELNWRTEHYIITRMHTVSVCVLLIASKRMNR